MTQSGRSHQGKLGTPEAVLDAGDRGPASDLPLPRKVVKPWGEEVIWAHTDDYAAKILRIHAGEALSLQFHEEKDETLYLLSGELRFLLGPGVGSLVETPFEVGTSVRIPAGTLHRMEAITDCTLLEASTPELDDVVRLQDRYGRTPSEGQG